MKTYWNEDMVRWHAVDVIYRELDTIVSPDDLEIIMPAVRMFRKFIYVECPEFDDFYLKVYVDSNGFPKKSIIRVYA